LKQLVLDMAGQAPAGFEHFVTGDNAALVAALHEAALAGSDPLYVWGPSGSGKSHLLTASAALAASAGHAIGQLGRGGETPDCGLLLVDDVESLDERQQIGLFNAFNHRQASGQTLLVAGSRAPRDLSLREDLRTRIGQALVFEIRPPNEAQRRRIIELLAERRGLRMSAEVLNFVLRHGSRDLPSLLSVFEALDQASLEHKRPITLPLLRSLLQTGLDL